LQKVRSCCLPGMHILSGVRGGPALGFSVDPLGSSRCQSILASKVDPSVPIGRHWGTITHGIFRPRSTIRIKTFRKQEYLGRAQLSVLKHLEPSNLPQGGMRRTWTIQFTHLINHSLPRGPDCGLIRDLRVGVPPPLGLSPTLRHHQSLGTTICSAQLVVW